MLFENIKKLVQYGIDTGLTPECERIYTTNLLLDLFHEENYEDTDIHDETIELETVLAGLLMRHVKGELLKTALCTETCLTQRL